MTYRCIGCSTYRVSRAKQLSPDSLWRIMNESMNKIIVRWNHWSACVASVFRLWGRVNNCIEQWTVHWTLIVSRQAYFLMFILVILLQWTHNFIPCSWVADQVQFNENRSNENKQNIAHLFTGWLCYLLEPHFWLLYAYNVYTWTRASEWMSRLSFWWVITESADN